MFARIRGGTGAFMLGTDYSYFFLQQGLKLQLNKQLSSYLETYRKSDQGLNPCCLTQDPVKAVDYSEKVPGIVNLLSSASDKVIISAKYTDVILVFSIIPFRF